MAKRPRFSRWRRLPGVFRTGEHRPTDTGTELDRIILYVPARILDLAEALAEKAGVPTVQDYCALFLMQALENERVQQKVADFEARRGPLEGLKQIADDPDYLAEWQEQFRRQAGRTAARAGPTDDATGQIALRTQRADHRRHRRSRGRGQRSVEPPIESRRRRDDRRRDRADPRPDSR